MYLPFFGLLATALERFENAVNRVRRIFAPVGRPSEHMAPDEVRHDTLDPPDSDKTIRVDPPPRPSHKTARVLGEDVERGRDGRTYEAVQADIARTVNAARQAAPVPIPIPVLESVTVYGYDASRSRAVPVVRFVLGHECDVHPIGAPASIREILAEMDMRGSKPSEGESFLRALLEAYPEDTASMYGALFAKPIFEPIPTRFLA